MNFIDTLEVIATSHPLQAVLIMANHGMGKSDCVKMAAKLLGIPCIDRRLSQDDVGDLKGMPYLVKGRTYFAPPDWFPLTPEDAKELSELTGQEVLPADPRGGILFLDEFNRATREVQNAGFEIILDHRLNMRKMPDNWKVVAAINDDADMYLVNEMCPATVDRFLVIPFNPDREEWFQWAKDNEEIHPAVYQFLRKYEDFLDPSPEAIKEASTQGIVKIHGRRSWHHFSRTLLSYEAAFKKNLIKTEILNKDSGIDKMHALALGHVGTKAARMFQTFIETDYQALDANVILNNFTDATAKRLKAIVDASRIPELTAYNTMIVEYIQSKEIKALSDKQARNLYRYMVICPNEVASEFWTKFSRGTPEVRRLWYKNSVVAKEIQAHIKSVLVAPPSS